MYTEDSYSCKSIQNLADKNRDLFQSISAIRLEYQKSIPEIRDYLISVNSDMAVLSIDRITVLVFADIEKYKLREIAEKLSIPMPTVKSRIQ